MAKGAADAGTPAAGARHARRHRLADGHGAPRARYRLRPAGRDAGDQVQRAAQPSRCPQPAGLRAVLPVCGVPARPGTADNRAGGVGRHQRAARPATPGPG
ncbi:hypothetical protein G6F63_013838 [Rhizopus arrhizus]|nr:hypothetical protein G6F63_013838 [Rhizopus arrhizus]KAG1378881.1 hypothetical protein G6F59_018082 [Rhizopus arrhizus]